MTFLVGCSGLEIRPDSVGVMEPEAAARLLKTVPDLFVLDVSPPDEFAVHHLEGAVNIPRSQLWYRMYDVPGSMGQPILVCDSRGERSYSAAILLRNEGYYRVYELRGGLAAWVEAGLPTR